MVFCSGWPPRGGEKSSAGGVPRAAGACRSSLAGSLAGNAQHAGGTRRFAFPKTDRLLKRSAFLRLKQKGKRRQNGLFILCYMPSAAKGPRVGITVTKKVGGAVRRNRIKRVCREFFRHHRHELEMAWDINIIAKREAGNSANGVLNASLGALFKPMV